MKDPQMPRPTNVPIGTMNRFFLYQGRVGRGAGGWPQGVDMISS
jgi:hypothetical protein